MRPAEEIRYLILAAQREGNRQLAQALQPLGVTPSQAEVLRMVADFQPLGMTELGELLVCESGTNPSRLVDRLVVTGLMERTPVPEDRRAVKLTLTADGRLAAAHIAEIEAAMYAMIDARTAGQNTDALIQSLRSLVEDQPSSHAIERRKQTTKSP
jgi:DNA-binding MarR family transcriptional regulator